MKHNFARIASSTQYIRLQRNLPQDIAANEAGISLRTLQNIEAGKSVNTSSLFAYLNYLDLLDNMLATLPDPAQLSPMEQLKAVPYRRARAGKRIKNQAVSTTQINAIHENKAFQWGDEK